MMTDMKSRQQSMEQTLTSFEDIDMFVWKMLKGSE